MNAGLRKELEEIFLTMHQTQEGRAVMAPLMIDRFISPDEGDYNSVRQMADEARERIARMVLKRLRASTRGEAGVTKSSEVPEP